MNITFLATFPNPNKPGVSKAGYRRVTELMKLLSEDNAVTLYTISKDEWTIDLPFCSNIFHLCSKNPLALWVKTLRAIINHRKETDLFIVYNTTLFVLPVILLKVLYSTPVVVDYVDKQGVYFGYTGENRIIRLKNLIIEKLFLLVMDNWITSSSSLQAKIKESKKESSVMLYRGVFSRSTLPDKAKLLPLKIDDDSINIAYSGGLYNHNGVEVLVNAFSNIKAKNVHLYITGFGTMKPVLEHIVESKKLSNVSILHLAEDIIHEFMSKMDIFVIPHKDVEVNKFNFPSKIIEYMWAGKAIISTNVGQAPYVFEQGKTAILIQSDNEAALSKAITDLLLDGEKIRELGANARKYYEENFTEEANKSKIAQFLQGVAGIASFSGTASSPASDSIGDDYGFKRREN